MNTKELDSLYIAGTYARFPVEIVRGEGSTLYDETGKEYIDMGSGIAANVFGYNDKQWLDVKKSKNFLRNFYMIQLPLKWKNNCLCIPLSWSS